MDLSGLFPILNFGSGLVGDMTSQWFHNDPDFTAKAGATTFYTDAALNRYFRDYDKSINLDLMRNQYDLEKDLSSTAYQRAIADMEKAGLNPAAMAGVNAQQASSPNISSNYHSSAGSYSHAHNYGGAFDSLFNSVLANDPQAAKFAAAELRDNAKHAHKMEELRESSALAHQYKLNEMRSKYRYENDVKHNPKADYYDEKALKLRLKRLGIYE